MTGTTGSRRLARSVLGGAALIAAISVGFALMRDTGGALTGQAASQVGNGQDASVIGTLEQRLAEKPDDAEGWRMLGVAYVQNGRHGDAAGAFRRATALAPGKAEYWAMLGEAIVLSGAKGTGISPEAQAAFDKALELDAKEPRARYYQAMALELAGQHRAAIEAWFALLADSPADAPWTSDVRQAIGEVAQANGIDVADRLGATAPEARQAGAAGQDSTTQDAMIRGMVDRLAARLADNPADADGWVLLMRSRRQLGDDAGARQALGDALAAFRNDPATSRRLREAAAALGVS